MLNPVHVLFIMLSFIDPARNGKWVWTSGNMLEAFAAAGPVVQTGLLIYEIRPWLTAVEHQ